MSLAVTGWAFPGVFVRLMPHLGAGSLVGLRMATAFLVLLPVALSKPYRAATVTAFRSPQCWLLGTVMLVYYLTASPAFYYAPVGEVALLIASAPLFAVLVRFVLRETVSAAELTGALMAVVGVAIMAFPSIEQAKIGSQQWIGVTLSITAAIAASLYAIGNRRLHQAGSSPGAVPQVLLTFFLGLFLLPFMAGEPGTKLHAWNLAWVIPLGAFSTALPTVAVAAAAHRISAVVATLINPMCAVAASIVAALMLHEIPSAWTLCGGALVVVAIYVAIRPQ